MIKRFIPFARATSLYEVDMAFYRKLGIKYLLSDLDNTLVPYHESLPSEECLAWKKALDEEGIALIILSNNTGKRVSKFASALGCEAAYLMRKPFSGPLKRYLKARGIAPEEALLVGDQITTDVIAANGAGVRCLLLDPIHPREPIWTKCNRLFDRPRRKKIDRDHLSKHWKELL